MIRIVLRPEQVRGLESAFAETGNCRLRDRIQIVLMAHRQRPRQQIATDLGIHTRTVQRWLNAYREEGLAGLRPRHAPGAKPRIPEILAEELRAWVIQGPVACGRKLANWTYETLAEHLGKVHDVHVRKSALHLFCRRHGIRPYRPTYRFLRGDPQKQRAAQTDLAALKKGRRKAR